MDWTRSQTIGLASASCTQCLGVGLRTKLRGQAKPCNCVFRGIFRACLERFHVCAAPGGRCSVSTLEVMNGRNHRVYWAMKNEDYMADFLLVTRRTLNQRDYDIFRFHFLLGADWKMCCRRLGMDRGNFFHAVYRIQERLGQVFSELEPYPLYPLNEYFATTINGPETVSKLRILPARTSMVLRPPVRKTA